MSFLTKKRAKKNLVQCSTPKTVKSSKRLGELRRSGNRLFSMGRKMGRG